MFTVDPSNCIGIADFASEYGCVELQIKAREYAKIMFMIRLLHVISATIT